MKKAFPYILVVSLVILLIYQYEKNKNVEQGTTSSDKSLAEQWTNWEETKKKLGYDVLDVAASIDWLAKHRDAISIPEKIDFLCKYSLAK